MKTIMKEVELAEDLKEAIAMCSDMHVIKPLKAKINKMDDDDLVLVEKEINKGIIIHSADIVTEEMIAEALGV